MPRVAVPILLDCDPGHDDAIAILLAAGHPGIDLRAITTVAGNGLLDQVTRNALGVATLAGLDGIPIAAGAEGAAPTWRSRPTCTARARSTGRRCRSRRSRSTPARRAR